MIAKTTEFINGAVVIVVSNHMPVQSSLLLLLLLLLSGALNSGPSRPWWCRMN
jgi:hypothetical protein